MKSHRSIEKEDRPDNQGRQDHYRLRKEPKLLKQVLELRQKLSRQESQVEGDVEQVAQGDAHAGHPP